MVDLEKLIRYAVEVNASDIFLKVGAPPCLRVHGKVFRLNAPPLTVNDLKSIAEAILTEDQMAAFEKRHELTWASLSLASAASASMSTSNGEALPSSCGCCPCASERWKNSTCPSS